LIRILNSFLATRRCAGNGLPSFSVWRWWRRSRTTITISVFRLATLTNSPPQTLEAQMQHAGLRPYFERLLSVDAVRQFKPARATYEYAAQELGVPITDIRLVAAHDWDIAGAMYAGCAAAFVARPGQVLGSLQAKPDIIGADLQAVARQIVAGGG
jgi:2-haloacid dehalogenase